MNFDDNKYDSLKAAIKHYRIDMKNEWEDIENLTMFDSMNISIDDKLNFLRIQYGVSETIAPDLWKELVNYYKKKSKPSRNIILSKGTTNDIELSQDPGSQWKKYEEKLINNGFSEYSINNIRDSSFAILQRLSKNTIEYGPIKGLVVGNVQSGKTANMAGLISMAADQGFNYFIVFSGVIENLRTQTANRLYSDLNLNGNLKWTMISNPSINSRYPDHQWDNIFLHETNNNNKYFTVCLKNKSRMESLTKWLYSNENKLKQLKILIIDDEADQASIDTKNIEDEEKSAINKCMVDLVHGYRGRKARGMNYLSYTATPYANVLNEAGKDTLYPSDFVVALEPSEDYIGPKEIFGIQEPEQGSKVDIVHSIPQDDRNHIERKIHTGKSNELPESFKRSIDWFLLTVASMRSLSYKKPISMLVHTSSIIKHHESVANAITEYLTNIRYDVEGYINKLSVIYNNESVDFTRNDFLMGMENYSTPDEVPDYPDWLDVVKQLRRIFSEDFDNYLSHIPLDEDNKPKYHRGFHIVIDNSKSRAEDQIVRLVYPDNSNKPNFAPMFIVIGGNTLSRGLTLEGLTTSYFLRTTNQADTLMQMGRWFGFRKGYEIFPRVWLDSLAKERFIFISQLNQDLIEEIREMNYRGQTPSDLALKIKNSPNNQFLRITSGNKMQGAIGTDLDFSGFNKQTVLFKNDLNELKSNILLTEKFLNQLDNLDAISRKGRLIWREVPYEKVRKYLENFIFSKNEIAFSNIATFLNWYDLINKDAVYSDWNIILSSKGQIPLYEESNEKTWNIQGYNPAPVVRTRRGDIYADGKTISIGALRTPSDLYVDIPNFDMKNAIANTEILRRTREEYGYDTVPQLIIYRIDKMNISESDFEKLYPRKNRNPEKEIHPKRDRFPLNFSEDIIGLSLMIPGRSENNNLAKHLSINLSVFSEDLLVDEEKYEEDVE